MKTSAKILLSLVLLLFVSATTLAQTVYVTRTGAKYHRGTCRYLHSSKIPTTLADAKENYTACSVCRPPTEVTEEVQEEVEIKDVEENTSPKVPAKNTPAANPATSSPATVSKARQCSASTKSGLRCKRTTTSSSGKCWQHE